MATHHITEAIALCRSALSSLWPIKTSPHLTKAKQDLNTAISLLYQASGGEDAEGSGLALELPDQEAEIVALAEDLLVRALTVKEAYYLGQMIQGFGVERVKTAILAKKRAKEPLRAAYADLQRKRYGQAAAKKDVVEERTNYAVPPDDWEPFA